MKALIDGDLLLYECGSLTNDEGHPLKWPFTLSTLDGLIKKIVRNAGADEYEIFITGKDNFREKEATIKPYKGQRTAPKPHHYKNIKDYFRGTKNHKVTFVDGYEADDAMAIVQYESSLTYKEAEENIGSTGIHIEWPSQTIICSRDKDLDMVTGWHYGWGVGGKKGKGMYFVERIDGWRWFFKQLLMGDSTDNIPGLFGVGDKSKLVKDVDKIDKVFAMYKHVQKHYEDRFGSYWKMFMNENARLLWMLESPTDDIRKRLGVLEDRRINEKYEQLEY